MQLRQGDAVVARRQDIGGIVVLPEAQDQHQVGVGKASQLAGLLDKGIQAGGKGGAVLFTPQHQAHILTAQGQRSGHILSDEDRTLKFAVQGMIENIRVAGLNNVLDL